MKRFNTRSQKGLSMVDMMLYLVVIALVLGGVFAVYRTVTSSSNGVQATVHSGAMVSKIKEFYAKSVNGYTGLTDQIVNQANLAPSDMFNQPGSTCTAGTNCLRSTWGSPVVVAPANINGTNDGFSITFADIPSEDCENFAIKTETSYLGVEIITSTGAGDDFSAAFDVSDSASGSVIKNLNANAALDRGKMVTACGDSGNVDVRLTTF